MGNHKQNGKCTHMFFSTDIEDVCYQRCPNSIRTKKRKISLANEWKTYIYDNDYEFMLSKGKGKTVFFAVTKILHVRDIAIILISV